MQSLDVSQLAWQDLGPFEKSPFFDMGVMTPKWLAILVSFRFPVGIVSKKRDWVVPKVILCNR